MPIIILISYEMVVGLWYDRTHKGAAGRHFLLKHHHHPHPLPHDYHDKHHHHHHHHHRRHHHNGATAGRHEGGYPERDGGEEEGLVFGFSSKLICISDHDEDDNYDYDDDNDDGDDDDDKYDNIKMMITMHEECL